MSLHIYVITVLAYYYCEYKHINFYFILYSEKQCISKLDKIGIH